MIGDVNPYVKWLLELQDAIETGKPANITPVLKKGIHVFKDNIIEAETLYNGLSNTPADSIKAIANFIDEKLKARILHIHIK